MWLRVYVGGGIITAFMVQNQLSKDKSGNLGDILNPFFATAIGVLWPVAFLGAMGSSVTRGNNNIYNSKHESFGGRKATFRQKEIKNV